MKISYLIGSYSTDLMGNAHHEEVIRALRAQGVDIEVLTVIAERGKPALARTVIHQVPVWQINALAQSGPGAETQRRLSARLFHYEHFLALVSTARRFYAHEQYDLIHAEAAYPFGAAALLAVGGKKRLGFRVQGLGATTDHGTLPLRFAQGQGSVVRRCP